MEGIAPMTYAKGTKVDLYRTLGEIGSLISRAGAGQFVQGRADDLLMVGFTLSNRQIKFIVPLPDAKAREFHEIRSGKYATRAATPDQARAKWEQAINERARALLLVIKAKLESAASGIETVEQAFLAQVVLPDGRCVGEAVRERLALSYETGAVRPLLEGPRE